MSEQITASATSEGLAVSEAENANWLKDFEIVDESEVESVEKAQDPSTESAEFKKLFEESLDEKTFNEGDVLNGTVVDIGDDFVTVDVGYKSEGIVSTDEFKNYDGSVKIDVGDQVEVYIEKTENDMGLMVLSKDKAEILKAWDRISKACESDETIEGVVVSKVKGGLSVDIGVKAFLPGSQVDLRPTRNLDQYLGKKFNFKVIKFNKKRGNIVLSRRVILQNEREEMREKTLSNLEEGAVVEGTVKNITEYGAFIDLGGIDGLLHITDMSWGRIKHPSELFEVGDDVKVKVLKYDKEKERVSLGLKQVQPDPWESLQDRYYVGQKVRGKVVSLKDYGAFVELEEGVEGLIHVSEMSWTQKVKHPNKVLDMDQEVDAVVLDIDPSNRRISLGIKQLEVNPWQAIEDKYPVGTAVTGKVKNIMDFGVFVDIGEGIDGLVHISDMSWTERINHPSEKFSEGDEVKAMVLSIDREAEKFSLGIKQLEKDPWEAVMENYPVGSKVSGKVTKLTDFGAFIEVEPGIEGLIHVSELSEDRVESPEAVAKVGETLEAQVIHLEPKERKIGLSVKALTSSGERENYENYSNPKSARSTMGDALANQLKNISDTNKNS
jgi:small subunit ribosomal protein S1